MARQPTPDVMADLGQGDADALAAAMGPQVIALNISAVRLDGGTQPRAGINQAVVEDYASDMDANGAEFPPVQVVYDGADYWLWDGFHRLHARKRNGLYTVPAIVRQGTRRDAVLLSVGANATHGFRRTNEDKRRAVLALLEDEEWGQWSDREIARRCAVSHTLVANLRAELSGNGCQIETRRVERNGTEYVMQTAKRSAGVAQGGQDGKWMTVAELVDALREWSGAFEDAREALAGLAREWEAGQGDYLEDWDNSAPAPWRPKDLVAAIGVLGDGLDGSEGLDGVEELVAMAADPYDPMELVEELVEVEPPAERKTVIAEQGTGLQIEFERTKTRQGGRQLKLMARNGVTVMSVSLYSWFDNVRIYSPGVDMTRADALALLDATKQAIAEISNKPEPSPLEAGEAGVALAADQERQAERELPQGEETRGMDVMTGDGRVLLRLTLGYPARDVWIELVQHQVRWLRDELSASLERLEAAEAAWIGGMR